MRRPLLLAALFTSVSVPAQDMLAVSWTGPVYAIDSYTGSAMQVATGLFGQNALARDGQGRLWSTQRNAASPFVYDLTRFDPRTGTTTVVYPNTVDVRGMTCVSGTLMLAVVNAAVGTADSLMLIDAGTGVVTPIGGTGLSGLQSIAVRNNVIYAFDANVGLVTLNPNTGAFTDVNTGLGSGGANVQWLAFRADGQLVGGATTLYSIDPATGALTTIASGLADLRGAELWQNFTRPFGTGCNGAGGLVTLGATLTGSGPTTLQTTSTNHVANVAGIALFGLSNSVHAGLPLPLLLDPLLGTANCRLLVSVDATVAGLGAGSALTIGFTFPSAVDVFPIFVQHLTLEPVTGGFALSSAAIVQLGF